MYYLEKGISFIYNTISFSRGSMQTFVAVLIGAVIVIVLLYGIARFIANSFSPKKTLEAYVVDKKIITHTQYQNGACTGTSYEYFITFESNENKRFKMKVTHRIYDSISMGDYGVLVRKGSRFVAFHSLNSKDEQQISL